MFRRWWAEGERRRLSFVVKILDGGWRSRRKKKEVELRAEHTKTDFGAAGE